MAEMIGKITLDDTHYPGRDFYCDGVVEDEILDIVKSVPPEEYGRVIEEKKSWPVLYHLSPLRENIVNWIPVKKTDKVLEVGSGCGAITGALAAMAGSVTCVELSRKRSLINAYRHPDCDNVTIKLGNFQDIEPELACDYDYIFLIGVFEYAQSYIGGKTPFETFLAIMQKHLAENGRLVIAIENRFGLKYWAGCREDHLGTYFDGIEGYPRGGGVRTFTRRALEEICRADGITEYAFYYPYPDYKFMTCVYSDERLPQIGELSDNMRNFDRDRLLLFDEKNVFDSLLGEKMFEQFSNSYVLVIGKPLPVTYARFSNDRKPKYAVQTQIRKKEGTLSVHKLPAGEAAGEHIRRLKDTCDKLEHAYAGSGLVINHCELSDGEAVFPYLEGKTLEMLLDTCLEQEDRKGFLRLFETYCDFVKYPKQPEIYDYDLIFPNLIIQDGQWNLIDYEWASPERIAPEKLIARALYCYSLGSEKRKAVCNALLEEKFGYTRDMLQELAREESAFQKSVTGERMAMVEIRNAIGYPILPAASFAHRFLEEEHRNRIQIYEDCGEGFSEENSYFIQKGYTEKTRLTVELLAKAGRRALRIDPSLDYCIVTVHKLLVGGKPVSLRNQNVKLNGNLISDNTIVFATQDPNITLLHLEGLSAGSGDTSVKAVFEVSRISAAMAESLAARQEKGRKGLAWLKR